jgi:hypothetical protein
MSAEENGPLSRRLIFGLFLAGLLVMLAAASLERAPGYMDADYYYAGALRIAGNLGTSEPYIWNFLNGPSRLPVPSFRYWMPLVSILAAAGLEVAEPLGFWGARLGFLLLAACIPPLTAILSYQLTHQTSSARLAGLLALFPGFYLAYLPTIDAFPLYMVLGGLFVLFSFGHWQWLDQRPVAVRLFGLGVLAGLLHLSRADGVLWLAGGLGAALCWLLQTSRDRPRSLITWLKLVPFSMAFLAGYGLVMAPWFASNLRTWGSLLPPGGARALWITTYEETMIFPADVLTPEHWLAAGWGAHLQAWWHALSNNFQTVLAVQGGILLLPFILVGMWKLRDCQAVRLGAGIWLLTTGMMTMVFPFAGANGAYFHSGAALQPLLWAVAPVGMERVVLWYARLRRLAWPQGMLRFVSALLVITSALLSGLLYFQRVVGNEPGEWRWNASAAHYQEIEHLLTRLGAAEGEAVLVNNPPGFWLAGGRPAVVIPFGDEQMLLSAARKYQVRYLVLETNDAQHLAGIFYGQVTLPELEYLAAVGDTRLFRINLQH